MRDKLPQHWRSRMTRVKLTDVPTLPDAKHIWPIVEGKLNAPGWWRVSGTERLRKLSRLIRTLRMRAFRLGFDSDCLTMLGAFCDGVCFTWRITDDQLYDVMRRRDARVEKRNGRQRKWRDSV